MRYVSGVDEQGNPIEVIDPLLPTLNAAVGSSADGEARVKALLGVDAIFGEALANNAYFVEQVTRAYQLLLDKGAKGAVAAAVAH